MTDELATALGNVDGIRDRVEVEADRLLAQVLHIVRPEGGE
jgi:hypothetical protein